MLFNTLLTVWHLILFLINIIMFVIDEIICWHWYVRKTYQTSLYRFNSYHELNLWLRCFRREYLKLEFPRHEFYAILSHFKFLRVSTPIIEKTIINLWYIYCWISWCTLTYYLYFHRKLRDLGPSHQAFEYSSEIPMSFYQTFGMRIIVMWTVWTYVADIVFIEFMVFMLQKFFLLEWIRNYWYTLTLPSCIDMYLFMLINSIYDTSTTIWFNYSALKMLHTNNMYYYNSLEFLKLSNLIVLSEVKTLFFWFPWYSFFNYLTVFGILYLLTILAIYNTENTYYMVLYTIFLLFLFAANLISLDLDIFAGLLLLIESVVILMLFFLIIYLTPNIPSNVKNSKWKLYLFIFIGLTLLSIYNYPTLGSSFFFAFSITSFLFDDFYEVLQDVVINDLIGIFTTLYITNSILMIIVGILLLIASIICVVLVSFFTRLRNYSFKNFLDIFKIFTSCYSLIFLRKQNLAKQGRGVASTRIFNKKTFDTTLHTEYREKYELYEKQQKESKNQTKPL